LKGWRVTSATVIQTTTYARPSPDLSVICKRYSHRSSPNYSVAALWWSAETVAAALRGLEGNMAWFGVGSGSRRAKPERAQRFAPADRVVVEAFADLRKARHLKSYQFSGLSPAGVQRLERKAWDRLIDYLIKLPPSRDD
jgi:hypothetical protein